MKLYAPQTYGELSPGTLDRICNGCGPASAFIDLIPDSLLGCDISQACNIHDFMYHIGETLQDKQEADRVFLNNLIRLVKNYGGFFMRVRLWMARRYFNAVNDYGGPAFWEGKNEKNTEFIVG